jgi:hypothetical protein
MAFAIRKQPLEDMLVPVGKASKPVKDKPYLAWLHSLPCVVTGRMPVEAAHISYADARYGKLGRGKGTKESDWWAVPLHSEEHARQHTMNEREYWSRLGIDPCIVALALHRACPDTGLGLIIINSIERRPALWQPVGGNSED